MLQSNNFVFWKYVTFISRIFEALKNFYLDFEIYLIKSRWIFPNFVQILSSLCKSSLYWNKYINGLWVFPNGIISFRSLCTALFLLFPQSAYISFSDYPLNHVDLLDFLSRVWCLKLITFDFPDSQSGSLTLKVLEFSESYF